MSLRSLLGQSLALIATAMSSVALPNTYNVTGTADGVGTLSGGPPTFSATTLRAAINAADTAGGAHTINLPPGIYSLTLGQIRLGNRPQNITISGIGAPALTTIQMTAASQDRIFLINPPGTNPDVVTVIQNITLAGGNLSSDIFGGGAMLAGGPNNVLAVHHCVFDGNTVPPGSGTGGAINFSGGGTLNIDQGTLFSNNRDLDPAGGGGAVWFFLQNNVSGSLEISGCTFQDNVTLASSSATSGGGALGIQTQGSLGSSSFSALVTGNTFVNNQAATGAGGGIIVIDAFGETIRINYNRIVGNTASRGGGLAVQSESGSVDATENWWGCNAGPGAAGCDQAGLFGTGGAGTLTFNPWIVLTHTAQPSAIHAPGGSPPQSATLIASVLNDSAGQPLSPSQVSALVGLPIAFSNPMNGAISGAQSSIQSSGTATATFVANAVGSASADAQLDEQTVTAQLSVTTGVPPLIGPVQFVAAGAQISFSGLVGQTISIQGSTDLITWQTLVTVPLTTPTGEFVDFFGIHLPHRFYRASAAQ